MYRPSKFVQFSPKAAFQFTRLLVLLSFVGTGCSILLAGSGFGELYPFATWKLYTQPLGNTHLVQEYRIYVQHHEGGPYVRQPVAPTPAFTPDEYVYTLNALAQAALHETGKPRTAKARLLDFARHVAPGAHRYQIVEERYHPKRHAASPQLYDTRTVIRF